MGAILTGHQLRIVSHFSKIKEQMLPTDKVVPMYRADGYGISVGLAYTEGDQNYIVRETVRWYASQQTIFAVAARLISQLGKTYARCRSGSENLFLNIEKENAS